MTDASTCPEIMVLSSYLDGELDQEQNSGVKLHLQNCPSCSAHIERLKATDTLLINHMGEPRNPTSATMKDNCLSPDVLTAYLHDVLSLEERKSAEAHLDGCNACVAELSALTKSEMELERRPNDPVPAVLRSRVEALWAKDQKNEEPIFRLAVRLLKDGLEVLRDSLVPSSVAIQEMFSPVGAYRSAEKPSSPSGVLLKRSLPGIEVTVILEWRSNTQAQLRTKVEDDRHQAVVGKRVFLRRNETLVFSDRTSADGVVVVPDLEIGSYELGISTTEKDFYVTIDITNT
jgi:anti-sigma factor RsiW